MMPFIVPMVVVSVLATLLKLSLVVRTGHRWAAALAAPLVLAVSWPWAVRWNLQDLQRLLESHRTLTDLGILLVAEAIVTFWLAAWLMADHYRRGPRPWLRALALQPSWASLLAGWSLLVWWLNVTEARSFRTAAFQFALVTAAVVPPAVGLIRSLCRPWQTRLEGLLLMSLGQLIFGMFLPLLAQGGAPPSIPAPRAGWAALVALALSVALATVAWAARFCWTHCFGDSRRCRT